MPQSSIDLLTRKKLMCRKYNNNLFSHQQLDFFSQINASEIPILLKQNPHLRQCPLFFQHLSLRQVQKIIASVFQPQQTFVRSQVFNILANVLRNSTMLLEICFRQAQFNYMSLFGFLEDQHVEYPVLILLEDVLLPFIKKSPFHVLEVIANDQHLEDIMLRRIYQKPIFKIMYTLIFCLSKRHSQTHKDHLKKIIHELVQTPFTYLSHKQKASMQKISMITLDKTQLKSEKNKSGLLDSSKDVLLLHTKKVKQRRGNNTSRQQIKSTQSPKLRSKHSLSSNYNKSRVQSQSSQSLSPTKRLRPQFSLQINQVQQLTPQQIRSITSIHRQKSIIFNEDLDYSDLTHNMKQLLSDIAYNMKSVDLGNFLLLLDEINQSYISGLVRNCERFIKNDEYEGYCEGAISVLLQFGEAYRAAIKLVGVCQDMKNQSESSTNSQTDVSLSIVVKKLEKQLGVIASKIPLLCACILQNNQTNGHFSSGQRLKKIGMAKYRMLQLIVMLLQFNSKQHPSPSTQPHLLSLPINFTHFDAFLIIEKHLSTLKWNNLTHCLLTKLAKLSLEQDYPNFKKRYISELQNPKDGILGTLMEIFRNKKFVFLKNMQFTNNGNLHVVYEISRVIVEMLKNSGDYDGLVEKFPGFHDFVNKDLLIYQNMISPSQLQIHQDPSELLINLSDKQQPIQSIKGTIQSAQDLINQLQTTKRWVPSLPQTLRSLQRKTCL